MTYIVPLNTVRDLSLDPADQESAVIQDIYCLLNTYIGEVPMYREFGIDGEFLHLPLNIAKAQLTSAVVDAIGKFMPELDVEDMTFSVDGERPDALTIQIEVTDSE